MSKKFTDFTLNDFKHLASTMDKVYRKHRNVARLNAQLMELCVNQGIPARDCQEQTIPAVQTILEEIWALKYDSKVQVIDAIAAGPRPDGPFMLTGPDKNALTELNDLEAQHDQYVAETAASPPMTPEQTKQLHAESKEIIAQINRSFKNFNLAWQALRKIEAAYIKLYDTFTSLDEDDPKRAELHKYATTRIFPDFKKYNAILDGILAERNALADKFYGLYENLTPRQRAAVTIPTTAFDAFFRLAEIPGSPSPQVSVNDCIPKSYIDAVKAGFNKTFFPACRVMRQTDLIRNCLREHDWPYIAYRPNMYQPWKETDSVREWVKRCVSLEQYDRPYIGI